MSDDRDFALGRVDMGTTERQMRKSLDAMSANHTARYAWAAEQLAGRCPGGLVLDAACGVAYGSAMLARAGFRVLSVDRSADARLMRDEYFAELGTNFWRADLAELDIKTSFDAAVSIETVEHLEDDATWLAKLRKACRFLVATVPNQDVVPWRAETHKFHFRHYTVAQFEALLTGAGWTVDGWFTQFDKSAAGAPMRPGTDGMTLGVVCR